MPEIKNQFTGGKMNKDVDERLVPKGEYRDAMNIQVSTSEGSDVGTVQNILGNTGISLPFSIGENSICVGSIADEKNDTLYWFVREPKEISDARDIIFQLPSSGPVKAVFVDYKNDSNGVLKFPSKIITGINIIDDMLFWTDGVTEPKKINIPRSIAGTFFNGAFHTRLINLDQNINFGSGILIEEKHITIVRKSPLKPPRLSQLNSVRNGTISGVTANLNLADGSGELFNEGNVIDIDIPDDSSGSAPNLEIGDTLRLFESGVGEFPPENYTARVVIDSIDTSGVGFTTYETTISTLSSENPVGAIIYEFALEEEGSELFERKFPRFAYRYKYADNEYSAIGPFSEVAFVPGNFSYHPTEAYNKGMVNNLKKLTLEGFIPTDIPKDVIQVDLLYKNETSPNIYVIKSIVESDAAWNSGGSYDILTENIQALLPSNQLLRLWDNVPKSALAQEITGNRIVYGNYTQGYDYSNSKALYSPEIEASIGVRPNQEEYKTTKSIKSLRTYDFGVVYGDEYGRETPVLTVSSATQVVPKSFSSNSNSINISLEENPPSWAEYCKVFVKETSNEYYNLAVDRVYDAEDGNVWLSFPSVDRNKVDEDTYIVLKKGIDNSEAVLEEARYKVVAIENEAPDYIKTSYTLISEPNQAINGFTIFGGDGNANPTVQSPAEAPFVGHTSFTINKNIWTNPYSTSAPIAMGLVNLSEFISELDAGEDLYVAFSTRVVDDPSIPTYTKRVSNKYLVTGINDDNTQGNTGSPLFEVHLSKAIPQSDDWLTTNINVVYDSGGQLKPHFYRQKVINKPEFDGRFFVKIIEDENIGNKVKPVANIGLDWKVVDSEPLYYLLDEDADATSSNGNTGYDASKTEAHWKNNLKFGSGAVKDKWFIDKASYAGTQPNTNNNIANSVSSDGGGTSWVNNTTVDSYIAVYEYEDPSTGDIETAYRTSSWNGTGMSLGVVFSNGLFTDSGDTYFHLSYSQLKSAPNNTSLNDNWNVGNSSNSHTEDQKHVTSNLKTGNYFRIRDNNTVYIITGVISERLYNYMGHIPFTKTNTQVLNAFCSPYAYCITTTNTQTSNPYYNFLSEMTSHHNKRLRYTIKYEVFDGTDALASNPKLLSIDNTTPGTLEFVEPFQAELPNIISSNPAIFETEPKEDTDLDIYYEAANSIPLQLTPDNQEQFIPIGATIDWRDTDLPKNLSVISWGGCDPLTYDPVTGYCDPMDEIVNLSTPIDYATYSLLVQLGEIRFIRDDGSFTSATILSATGVSANSPYTFTGLQIQITKNIGLAWFNCWSFDNGVESNRIGDTFNKPFITNGVKVSTPLLDQYKQETRKYGLIYSGIYNSNSGVNNLNQFIAAEKITKDINPIHGSIQKLKAGWGQSGDLVALCEDRVLKILANKDALFNADGNVNVTSTNNVLGQAIPYSGQYGISKNPESFASDAYRIYFTDKVRGAVMRLSMDGLTPISNHGMKDWFKDNLKINNTILGSYDDKKDEYNVTLQQTDDAKRNNNPVTISFKEDVKGWVSFKSFTPENAISCANEYYTFKYADIWKHHDELAARNTFYNEGQYNSTLNVILNDLPGSVKSFNTINYEGSQSRVVTNFQDNQYYNLEQKPGWYVDSVFTNKESGSLEEFIEKEGKWFNYIKGKEVQHIFDSESAITRILIGSDGSSSFDQASFAIQGLGVLGGAPTNSAVLGCTDPTAFNYNASATVSDGSCIPFIYGCTESSANNTCNNGCNTDDGGCVWYGCTDPAAANTDLFTEAYAYNGGSTIIDDGSCFVVVYGCTDPTAFNYDGNANNDDGSCVAVYVGCLEPTANENYNALVNTDNGTCIWRGCTDITANNYLWEGSTVDGLTTSQGWNFAVLDGGGNATNNYLPASSAYGMQDTSPNPCTYNTGCIDPNADNTSPGATVDDGSCTYCNQWAENEAYDVQSYITVTDETFPSANDGTITISVPNGTLGSDFAGIELLNDTGVLVYTGGPGLPHTFNNLAPGDYYTNVIQDPSSFISTSQSQACNYNTYIMGVGALEITVDNAPAFGCTDPSACNYCASCTNSASLCEFTSCAGCTDPTAFNYDPTATIDDGGCIPVVNGCTDPTANNQNPSANVDDGSCTYDIYGCMDSRPRNDLATTQTGAYFYAATNYEPLATINETSASNSSNPCKYTVADANGVYPPMSASTIGDSSPGNNAPYGHFLTYSNAEENWTVKKNAASTAHSVYAIWNVSNLPLIRWPGYNADGTWNGGGIGNSATSGTRFSYATARNSGCQGNITEYWGGNNQASGQNGFRWYYSTDNGDTWTDGENLTYTGGIPDQAIQLVRINKYVSSTCSSYKIDWTTYPNGYNGKFKQDARFSFLSWDWNVGGTQYTETIPIVAQYTESPYVNSGCKFSNFCNYDSSANFPTGSTYNPCGGGTPGCLDPTACNGDPFASCSGGTCTYETWGVDFVTGACQSSCDQSGESSFVDCCNVNPSATNC